jgi:hypothetical protein
MDPRYQEITSRQIPEVAAADASVRVICGEAAGTRGPVQDIVTDPLYLDVTVPARARFTHAVKPGHTVLAYVFEGQGYFDPGRDPFAYEAQGANYFDVERTCIIGPEHLVVFGDGGEIDVTAADDGVRFLLFAGRPLGEPVAWYGPIVMNTREELRQAFDEYAAGTFIKHQAR